jgi:hypothetical protein
VSPDEPSLSEVLRRLERIEKQIDSFPITIEQKFEARMLAVSVYQAEKVATSVQLATLERDVAKLESSRVALQRLVIAALLAVGTEVVAFLLVGHSGVH